MRRLGAEGKKENQGSNYGGMRWYISPSPCSLVAGLVGVAGILVVRTVAEDTAEGVRSG